VKRGDGETERGGLINKKIRRAEAQKRRRLEDIRGWEVGKLRSWEA